MGKIKIGIIGPENIGIDLMYKILTWGRNIELSMISGVPVNPERLMLAKKRIHT